MAEEKKLIKERMSKGEYKLRNHATIRIPERFVTHQDIQKCGKTCKEKDIKFQPDRGTWLVRGKDLDGDAISVVCSIDQKGPLWIVTVIIKD